MTNSGFDKLRDDANKRIGERMLPKTTKDVERVTGDAQHIGSICSVCCGRIAAKDFMYTVYDTSKTPTANPRPMHPLCHAAWLLEVEDARS